jgi:hypothetical protein
MTNQEQQLIKAISMTNILLLKPLFQAKPRQKSKTNRIEELLLKVKIDSPVEFFQ